MKAVVEFEEKRVSLKFLPESPLEELELLQLGDFLKENRGIQIDVIRSVNQTEINFS